MRPAHLDLLLSPINKLKGVGPKLENIINCLLYTSDAADE